MKIKSIKNKIYNKQPIVSCVRAPRERGAASVITVIIILSASFLLLNFFAFSFAGSKKITDNKIKSQKTFYTSEAGMEDGVYRIKNQMNYTASNTLPVGSGQSNVTITANGNVKTILSEGVVGQLIRRLQSTVTITTSEISFHYGVQIGEGGLEMDQNSQIIGSVYSNGPVAGLAGATITGDAQVAGGSNPTLDANWTRQTADFSFGNTFGTITTTIDSAGSVGEYNSIAIGSDGFARISYTDNTNKDLKFARCTNADCTTKNITTIDSLGELYEVTSIALDANNFAYISYYHDGNDDLKFARCADVDCAVKNITTIESAGNVGDTSAIKIDSDGFARIAYFQDDNNDLKFARCTNADCTTKNTTTIDSANYVGEHLSLALGQDGFARISYLDDTNSDLKFARCADADCANKNITIIDSAGNVGKYNSLALNSNGFAKISYFNDSNNDLKFVNCTNADCTNKNIATIDSAGSVGEYTSLALGQDGFARISYYDSSDSALKFARCTNADCTTKNISTIESAGTVGEYTSIALGPDGFARISYHNNSNDDLKYARCTDADCSLATARADAAQSFRVSADNKIRRASLYIKKMGSPSDITIRIMGDKNENPSDESGDIVASGTLAANTATTEYGWIDVSFTTNPVLSASQTYWLMADAGTDNNNYWIWGSDNTNGYAQGTGKYSTDWNTGNWSNIGGDLNFKIWVGGSDTSINNVSINGNAYSHTISNSNIGGSAEVTIFSDSTASGNVTADNISNCTIGGNAAYNVKTNCSVGGSQISPTNIPTPPPLLNMPVSQANIDSWKADAQAGGTITGDVTISADTLLGPKEITGDLTLTSNNKILTITGTVYIHGNIDISNGSSIQCSPSYGVNSCIILNDGWTHIANNGTFSGSGQEGSYLLLLTTSDCDGSFSEGCSHHNAAMDIHNNATGAIFYAQNGMINLHNGVNITEAVAYKLRLDNNAVVTYTQGLANANFTSGPGASWQINDWKEVE